MKKKNMWRSKGLVDMVVAARALVEIIVGGKNFCLYSEFFNYFLEKNVLLDNILIIDYIHLHNIQSSS